MQFRHLSAMMNAGCSGSAMALPPNTDPSREKIEEAHNRLVERIRGEQASRGLVLLLLDAETP